jgi:hypothetical protein
MMAVMSPRGQTFFAGRSVRHDVRVGSRSPHTYNRKPGQHALHLRWLDDDLFNAIRATAKYRNMRIVTFVSDILRLYLKGGQSHEVGVCEVCRRRAALSGPTKVQGKVKMKGKGKTQNEGKTKEAPTCRHGNLTYHPGCLKPDGTHNHGPCWPREKCEDEACRRAGNARLENLRNRMLSEQPRL